MVADVIRSIDSVDRSILDCALVRPGLPGLEGRTFLIIVRFVSGLSSLLVLGSLGVGTVVYLRVVPNVWCSSLSFLYLGVGPLSL